MAPQDPQAAALLGHVVSQLEQNVNFLASQNYISQSDASAILSKLPNDANDANDADTMNNLTNHISHMSMPTPRAVPPPPRPPVNSEQASLPQVRALWAYNGEDPGDLQFSKGDVIEIVEEINADWHRGCLNGKQGLVPSAYVEKIAPVAKSAKPYKPFVAAYHGMTAPPPPGEGTNHIGLQEKAGTEEKKDKMGRYKNTMAHSAVAGVGFGAGSAIGGGLVRAIF